MDDHETHTATIVEHHCGYGSNPTKIVLCSCGEMFDIKRKAKKIKITK